jgi:hypothetical protein
MTEIEKAERALLKTRKTLYEVCRDLDIEVPDPEELCIDQCSHCSVWHYQYKLREDLDGNNICGYCENLVGR